MAVKAVTFDLWETLIADSPDLDEKRTQARVRQIATILEEVGLGYDEGRIATAHSLVWKECSRLWQQAQDISFSHQIEMFLDLITPDLRAKLPHHGFDKISQIYARAVLLYPPALIAGACETLHWLRAGGYRLGLICNTGRSPGWILRELLSRFCLLHYFDTVLFSDETIVRKPDPTIFHRALKDLGTAASDTMHVGDSWENDIQGALAVGMSAIWIGGDHRRAAVPCLASVADLPRMLQTSSSL